MSRVQYSPTGHLVNQMELGCESVPIHDAQHLVPRELSQPHADNQSSGYIVFDARVKLPSEQSVQIVPFRRIRSRIPSLFLA